MQTVVKNILTNYIILGNSSASETVLVLHGWGRSLDDWTFLHDNLENSYKIIILDLPGFGNTEFPPSSYTVYDYAKYVQIFLKKQNIEKCTLIGHSFGGRLGIILASTTDLVSKLILVDAAGIEKKSLKIKSKIFLAKVIKKILSLVSLKEFAYKVTTFLSSSDYVSSGELKSVFKNVVSQDLTHHLSGIDSQTLIIWGEKDKVLPIQHAQLLQNSIPNATLRIVWGAGHSPFLEKPTEFLEILKEVLC